MEEEENNSQIEINYHKNQLKIFFESSARYKVITKGRRFGLTKGMANYLIEMMFDKTVKALWVDTTYSNIQRYVERYILPVLKDVPKYYWKWRKKESILEIGDSYCDFRSADRPENIEGFGYNEIILNEAGIILKNRKLWIESIRPMVLDYKANVIIGGTPKGKKHKGEKHLFFELSELCSIEKDWELFQFSTYDNPLIDVEEIKQLEREIASSIRDQEIYGKFIDVNEQAIIKKEWWQYYRNESYKSDNIIGIYQSWDTAFKKNEENDFSVCTTWAVTKNKYYLINVYRERLTFPELKRIAVQLYMKYNPVEILIEDKASGTSLIQELKSESLLPIKEIKVDGDKIARANAVTPLIENGKVFIDENAKWKKDFVDECEDFPNGQFDDQVDSTTQFLNYIKTKTISTDSSVRVIRYKKPKRNFRNTRG
ncbi:MAG: phage terminase large subunit [Melioribacteraceae bacterium]